MIARDIYQFSKDDFADKYYGTTDIEHPGVKMVSVMKSHFIGGEITLLKHSPTFSNEYGLVPKQVRRLFEEKNWTKIVGFHTRNVVHKAHEYIQEKAINNHNCDGIFLHPVIGEKKAGDYESKYLISSYKYMMQNVYTDNKAVFAIFSTYSRYGGQKEALFTAICRQNYGCSHFIVGRDHTGSGYNKSEQQKDIFNEFPDLGIAIIKFEDVYYSRTQKKYLESKSNTEINDDDKAFISGTQAREMFLKLETPPDWYMRKDISTIILNALKNGEKVFV